MGPPFIFAIIFGNTSLEPLGNFAAQRNLNHRWRTFEFDVTIRTNSGGYREDFEFRLADVEFAFMGDSFTFGHGVEVSERYTNLFSSRLKGRIDPAHVVSLGRNDGFQPEHYEYFLFFPGDAHWNKEGHRKAADLLHEYFSASEGWR